MNALDKLVWGYDQAVLISSQVLGQAILLRDFNNLENEFTIVYIHIITSYPIVYKYQVLRGHNSSVRSVSFSLSGTHVVSASICGEVKLWSTTKGTQVGNTFYHTFIPGLWVEVMVVGLLSVIVCVSIGNWAL